MIDFVAFGISHAEMENDGRSGCAAFAYFPQLCQFLFFSHVLLKVFGLFCAILGILHEFGIFLHIFCVQFFQTRSFACAIL